MKRIHTVTTSLQTYARIVLLLGFSVVFVRAIPFLTERTEIFDFFSNQVVNMGILYAIIVGFLMSIALQRKQALDEYISLELNKVRRIFHLGKHLAVQNPKLKKWFTELQTALSDYAGLFCSEDFSSYELGNPLFRKVTYAIYRLPKMGGGTYNSDLYRSLLDTAASATEARENIRARREQSIGFFQWIVIILIALTLSAILVASTPDDPMSRVVTTAVVFNLFLVLHLLYEFDIPNTKMNRARAGEYAHNLHEIDQCPPEKPKKTRSKRK